MVMPKVTKHPKLRVHVKRGKAGQVWTSYFFDMRGTGKKDIPLGSDYPQAIAKWQAITEGRGLIEGTIEQALEKWEREVLPTKHQETKRDYTKSLKWVRLKFGGATWDAVTLPDLKKYLEKRTAKTRANRELALLSIVWNAARVWGMTDLPYPAHNMKAAKWKNPEEPRQIEVSDAMFSAIYRNSDVLLRNALDIATSTGLRVRDVLGLRMSDVRGDVLRVQAGKTGRRAEFDIHASPVLTRILAERKLSKAPHLFLLTFGNRIVSERMLSDRFKAAREAAAKEVPECSGLYLRDMRKRAGQLAGSVEEASKLLQHSSTAVTRRHYVQGEKVRPVR